ncbi:MAG: MSMEG_0570 family nitrogen starvation response protein [Cyanobacteria bacterium]|nr:MSMEG_0570 family nitrogen starvation response protein [Cyanobacteriota bacterium]MDA0867271.1 MSMEG_0570 family nitrogen starvation response protein [Cyanobacteriota bacterium]
MPEMHVQVQWPDGSQDHCYSPSLVIKQYFLPGETYPLEEFVSRARTALTIASDRVQAKYGFPCGRALGQLQRIESKSHQYQDLESPQVQVLQWLE